MNPITQRFQLPVAPLSVAIRQVVSPALCLVPFNVGQIPEQKLVSHQNAAEYLPSNRACFKVKLGHQRTVMLSE